MIIIISGKQGSGKTTLAKGVLFNTSQCHLLKFADPLYEMHETIRIVAKAYDIPFEKKEGKLLQFLGTEWGRSKDENIWVNVMRKRIEKRLNDFPEATMIIDDCRFENEFYAFPSAIKIRLEASEEKRKQRAEGWRENVNHPSEIGLDNIPKEQWDLIINTDLATKEQTLNEVLNYIESRKL